MAGSRLATRRGDTKYERAHTIDDKRSGPIPESVGGGQQVQDDKEAVNTTIPLPTTS
jgi:hypothetical protein